MPCAVIPPVAPASPKVGGAAPHFSAKLGAWAGRPEIRQRAKQGFGSSATNRRPGNVRMSDRAKWWLACALWNAIMWGALAWIVTSLYRGSGQ